MTEKVFVYGILKRHADDEDFFTKNAEFVMGSFDGFPACKKGGGHKIKGKIVDVDDATLAHFDTIEGNGFFYNRERVEVEGLDEPAWMYLLMGEVPASQDGIGMAENEALEWLRA